MLKMASRVAGLRETVGDDLYDLLSSSGLLPVVSVSRISALSSPRWNRAAFRFELSDGSLCKGRRFESEETAARVTRLSRYLPSKPFPRIIAQQGLAELSEWIDGDVLSSRPITHGMLRQAGEIARAIHAVALPQSIPTALRLKGERWRDLLAAKAETLRGAGMLSPSECARALELADAHAPATVRLGLVHGDLCPENLIVDADGNLHVIDHDSIAVRTREYDLARISYRWPMTLDERRAFEAGYADRDALASYQKGSLCWAVVVLIGAAEFRFRNELPDAEAPLGPLREILNA